MANASQDIRQQQANASSTFQSAAVQPVYEEALPALSGSGMAYGTAGYAAATQDFPGLTRGARPYDDAPDELEPAQDRWVHTYSDTVGADGNENYVVTAQRAPIYALTGATADMLNEGVLALSLIDPEILAARGLSGAASKGLEDELNLIVRAEGKAGEGGAVSGVPIQGAGETAIIPPAKATDDLGNEIGILRGAAQGKGNFGLGSATAQDAVTLGKAWVGDGYAVASDGKTLVSSDGLRQFPPPSTKPRLGINQENFESRAQAMGQWQSNGHLDIKP